VPAEKDRPGTLLDRVFDFPLIYRAKVSLVKILVRPVSRLLIRNRFSEEEVILSNVPYHAKVFEMGCGDGNGFTLLADAGLNISYTGSDYNSRMVEHCRRQYPQATWEDYNGGSYPHLADAFDVCLVRHVLHHIAERKNIVFTIREALRIAGQVVLIEPLQSETSILRAVKSAYWRLTDGGVNYMRLDEIHGVLHEAGANITWEVVTEPLRQAYACTLQRQ
jgi:SAM-dependent methyltransferase